MVENPTQTPPSQKESSKEAPQLIPYEENEICNPSPRVQENEITVQQLLQPSNLPKNLRFRNTKEHKYNLCSKPHLIQHTYSQFNDYDIAEYIFDPHFFVNHIYKADGTKETIDTLLQGSDSNIWKKSLSNDWGRLAQENDYGVKGTDTIQFIHKRDVPHDKKVTYASFVCNYRPLKDENTEYV